MSSTELIELQALLALPAFRKFLFRAIQTAGILAPTTNGSDGRNLDFHEGRRSLGFDLLADAARGQPVPDDQGLLTLHQILREELQQQPEEPKHGKRSRYDRNSELRDTDDADADGNADE